MNFNKKMIGISIMLLFSSLTMLGMEKELKIRTNDMQESEFISIDKDIAEQVKCIADMQDFDGEVFLPNISKKTFGLVLPYLKLLGGQPKGHKWYAIYKRIMAQRIPFEHIIELIKAADYLSCEPLVEACAEALAHYGMQELKTIDESKQITIEKILLEWPRKLTIPAELSTKVNEHMFRQHFYLMSMPSMPSTLSKELKEIQIHKVVYSADKQLLAGAVCQDGYVYIWNTESGEKIDALSTRNQCVEALCFSPDKKWLAVALSDKSVCLWNLEKKKNTILPGHQANIVSVSFSPDSQELISGSSDNTVFRWDLLPKVQVIHKYNLIGKARCNGYVKYKNKREITADSYSAHEQFLNRFMLAHPEMKELKTDTIEQTLLYVWISQAIENDQKVTLANYPTAKALYQDASKNEHTKNIFDSHVTLEKPFTLGKPSFLNTCTIS